MQSRYVLLLPADSTIDLKKSYLSVPGQLSSKKISSLIEDKILLAVESYSPDATTIRYSFANIPRAWYYTRIASVQSNKASKAIYTTSSPWSHHVVAGQQLIADTDGPNPQVRLVREQTN